MFLHFMLGKCSLQHCHSPPFRGRHYCQAKLLGVLAKLNQDQTLLATKLDQLQVAHLFSKKTHTLEDFGCHSKLCPSLTQFENPLLPNTLTRIGSRRRTEYLGTSCKFEHPLNFTEDYHYCYYHFFGKGLASKHCLKTLWKYR